MDQAEADMVLIQEDIKSSPDKKALKKLPVVEIFGPTIQGEGITAGQRTIFIRFGLCDYSCKMCDSMHAVDPDQVKVNAKWMTQYEIAEQVLALLHQTNCLSVTYSGGNPCIHDLTMLTRTLLHAGVSISVETQGTFTPEWLSMCEWITVSPKGPGMGEKFEREKFNMFMNTFLRMDLAHSCIKIVIFSAQDLEFASAIAEDWPSTISNDRFYLSVGNPFPPGTYQPFETGEDATADEIGMFRRTVQRQTEQVLEDLKGFPALRTARILPQVHTLLWGQAKGR